jgi:hypothetical protein
MGLSITVQKGHDFSSGNVTRAALNAGATPTIAITGSVGASEIAALSINNAQIKADAAIAVTKLGLTADSLIIGDGDNEGSVLSPTSAFSSIGNDADSNCGLLVDTGAKFELLKTDVSAIGGHIRLTKYLETIEGSDDKFWLKLSVVDGSLGAGHLLTENTLDDVSIGKNSAGKFEVKDNGVHHQKLYNYRDSSSNPKAGFLYYGSGGTAKVLEATGSNQVAVTGGTNGDFSLKTFDKVVNLGEFTNSQLWKRHAHGLGVAPSSITFYLECTEYNSGHDYAVGDRIYWPKDITGDGNDAFSVSADATYVTVHCDVPSSIGIYKKSGGNASVNDASGDPIGETHSGSDVGFFAFGSYAGNFDAVVRVNT